MTPLPLRWSDAIGAAEMLTGRPSDRNLLLLLTRLPFIPARVIEQLEGLGGSASVYRRLTHCTNEGLIASVSPPMRPGHGPQLWYLTDLGLAVVAYYQGRDLADLARRNHIQRSGLLARLAGLPYLLGAYELLGALAASRPGRPDLLAWERPWRRRTWSSRAKAPRWLTFPAYAALAWDQEEGDFVLLPDLAPVPLRSYQPSIRALLTLRSTGSPLPALLITTTHTERLAAWRQLLADTCRARGEPPLRAEVATWTEIRRGLVPSFASPSPEAWSGRNPIHHVPIRPAPVHRRNGALPRLIGPQLAVSERERGGDRRLAILHLGATERALLDFIGRHPFLAIDQLAATFDRGERTIRNSVRRLVAAGFLRTPEPGELGSGHHHLQLFELTQTGLTVVAAQQGLSLSNAVRFNGLAGGGTSHPVGTRRKLALQITHTRCADGVFVRLITQARISASAGGDDALLEWRNAAACVRGKVRPDGYGLYRHQGSLYGFFLEYDRGTMSARAYRAKLAAYSDYFASGRFTRDYDGFPTILVVVTSDGAEQKLARAARETAISQSAGLPVLLTSEERVQARSNPFGLLGAIWRTPASATRRLWLVGPTQPALASRPW